MNQLTLDTQAVVYFYEQAHYYLSNFSAFRVRWLDQTFDTAEHAYHFTRFRTGSHERAMILAANSAHEAFRFAQENKHRQISNFDDHKVGIMRDILRAKTRQHEYVKRKLVETGTRRLIENSWRDDFWGWGPNRDGKNMLGVIWQDVREEIR